jgi:hypothetical protein
MKHLENSKETDKVYLEMSDLYSVSYTAKRKRDIRILPMCAATVNFALEGIVASEVGILGLSYIPTGRSRMQ